jgi:cell division protein FtsI (penicillin-binding protein 3)
LRMLNVPYDAPANNVMSFTAVPELKGDV